jgi:2-phosphosulfolactate phosphatase
MYGKVQSVIMTRFRYYSLANAHLAGGVVVVIDVLRAFTTAAYALANGAMKIYPVKSVEEAMMLKSCIPGSLVMGEVDGFKPDGFDFNNSPDEIRKADLNGRILIQRTSAGTQGVVCAENANQSFAVSFVVARATAMKLRLLNPDLVSFIVTGESQGRDGDEDRACGEYIEALYKGKSPKPAEYVSRVETSTVASLFLNGKAEYLKRKDIELSKQVDQFDFYLSICKESDLLVIKRGGF